MKQKARIIDKLVGSQQALKETQDMDRFLAETKKNAIQKEQELFEALRSGSWKSYPYVRICFAVLPYSGKITKVQPTGDHFLVEFQIINWESDLLEIKTWPSDAPVFKGGIEFSKFAEDCFLERERSYRY